MHWLKNARIKRQYAHLVDQGLLFSFLALSEEGKTCGKMADKYMTAYRSLKQDYSKADQPLSLIERVLLAVFG